MVDWLTGWLLAISQGAVFVLAAPLLSGWIRVVKARLRNRTAPPALQPYRDLRKLFNKEVVLADSASPVFRAAPYLVFGTTALAASVVPLFAVELPSATIADAVVLVGFLAFARFFLALAGMDVGTAFGGMGASREMTLAALAEPATLMIIFTLAMTAGTTNLSIVVQQVLDLGFIVKPSFVFALVAMILVAVAETGRIPVDNPETHLELTMIHEAMILEYSGRHLALMEWAAQVKLMLFGTLIANLFFPWGIAIGHDLPALFGGIVAIAVKLGLLAVLLAIGETVMAKMRLFRVPHYLAFSFILSFLAMVSHVVLETAS